MTRKLIAAAAAALSIATFTAPAHSQPLTVAVAAFRQAGGNGYTCTMVSSTCVGQSSFYLNVLSNVSVDNLSGNVTPAADFSASAYGQTCTFTPMYTCTSWF